MNKFKCTFNRDTICVFAVIEEYTYSHLANIDTLTNRIYTTMSGYDLFATDIFKKTHKLLHFDSEGSGKAYDLFEDLSFQKSSDFRKFDTCVDFNPSELDYIVDMCSRELKF